MRAGEAEGAGDMLIDYAIIRLNVSLPLVFWPSDKTV